MTVITSDFQPLINLLPYVIEIRNNKGRTPFLEYAHTTPTCDSNREGRFDTCVGLLKRNCDVNTQTDHDENCQISNCCYRRLQDHAPDIMCIVSHSFINEWLETKFTRTFLQLLIEAGYQDWKKVSKIL